MSDEYDILDEVTCNKCNQSPVHACTCTAIACEDGMIDESDEDFCVEGTVMVPCNECQGTGRIIWCPHCGADLSGEKIFDEEENEN